MCVQVVTQLKRKLCNTTRESYARESFCQGVQFLPFLTVHISRSIFDDCFLREIFNHEKAVLVVLCNWHVWCEPRRAKGRRQGGREAGRGPGSSVYRVGCHCTGPPHQLGPCSSSKMGRERRAQHSVKQGHCCKSTADGT